MHPLKKLTKTDRKGGVNPYGQPDLTEHFSIQNMVTNENVLMLPYSEALWWVNPYSQPDRRIPVFFTPSLIKEKETFSDAPFKGSQLSDGPGTLLSWYI